MKQLKAGIAVVGLGTLLMTGCVSSDIKTQSSPQTSVSKPQEVTINSVKFMVSDRYDFFTWETLPQDVIYEREPIKEFTNVDGKTHYYEVVHLTSGNLNWFQAAYLADKAGGYMASITSAEENAFLFSLVDDEKYFWKFPKYVEGRSKRNHYEIMIGPMLGGYQPDDAKSADSDWHWLSGEKWQYTNWAQNLDDGVIDRDPRNNTQPNDSGSEKSQRLLGFGELNQPVPTWGDYSDDAGTYGMTRTPKRHAFIIEYEVNPN